MKTFEIHITGEEGINAEFDKLGFKNIVIDLLKPDLTKLRTEYMSSFVKEFETYGQCLNFIYGYKTKGSITQQDIGKPIVETQYLGLLDVLKSKVIRVKVEVPYLLEYRKEYRDKALYIESHYIPDNNKKPLSRNVGSGKIIATDRAYWGDDWNKFYIDNRIGQREIEMCLHDSFVEEDKDWFDCYKVKEPAIKVTTVPIPEHLKAKVSKSAWINMLREEFGINYEPQNNR